MTALCVVFLGTLLPLVHKQLGLGSISIGAPFFDQMFLIIMTPFALLLGIGPLVKWRRDQFSEIRTPVVVSVIVMAIAGFVLPYFLQNKLYRQCCAWHHDVRHYCVTESLRNETTGNTPRIFL